MTSKKRRRQHTATPKPTEYHLDPVLVKLLVATTVAYILLWAVVGSLLGKGFATLFATPLWGLSLFVIAKWDRTRTPGASFNWKQIVSLPRLNYWNILGVISSIFISSLVFGILAALYFDKYRPDFNPDSVKDLYSAIAEDTQAAILLLIGGYLSHTVGGIVAGKLPNKKGRAPYRHAVIGSLIYVLFNIILTVPLLSWGDPSNTPTEREVGFIILGSTPAFIFALCGAWLVVGDRALSDQASPLPTTAINNEGKVFKQQRRKSKRRRSAVTSGALEQPPAERITSGLPEPPLTIKSRWSHRRIAILLFPVILIALVGSVLWLGSSKSGTVKCLNPPTTATLNFWPVTYSSPAEFCHDYPTIDARHVNDEAYYSRSREEWENGRTAHSGDELYVLVYINNGAGDNAEEINPGHGIARNVRVSTEVDQNIGAEHYVQVRLAGDNTNTIVDRFKITTAPHERLEVIPNSGEIRNYTATELIAEGLNVGNSTIVVEDLPPKFESSVFVRFRVKVVS